MSDGIHNDVFRTESEEINQDRVEKTVDIYESADCVRDHDSKPETNIHQPPQQTGYDRVKIRSSTAAVVCLVLLCVLLLTAVIVLCVHIHTNNTNYTQETHQLLTKLTNLTKKGDELLTKNINLTDERDGLLTKNDNLTKQREQFIQKRNELVKSLNETDGWYYYKFSFYFISYERKSWTDSKTDCTKRGADLIIINNKEEQDFVKNTAGDTYFWIGLTNRNVEGKWKWVNGSTLTSGFWASGQPNGQTGKNYAVSNLSGWYNRQCNNANRWICEKSFVKHLIL